MWSNALHPIINHDEWTADEDRRLLELVLPYEKKVGGVRDPYTCAHIRTHMFTLQTSMFHI